MKIAIIGNGIQANIGALYLKKKFGDRVHITRIGPDDRGGFPVVGESIIEITTHFLEEHLGLATYFRDHHLPKYALTYYFKVDPDNPEDRTYSVHCNERAPSNCRMVPGWTGPMDHPPSWLLNRDVFDRDLHQWVDEATAIRQVKGLVDDVDIHPGGKHLLHVTGTDGTKQTVEADWVIDTTGRRQLLGRKFNLVVKPEGQRDCFWFRIKNFDKSLLKNVNALGPMPAGPGEEYHYERYYSTHHFMGKGFWIWLIPMKGENGEDMMSIGFTSHPGHFQGNVRNIEGFLAETDKSHRVVSDLVRSGEVMDINKMVRYHYVVKQVYSPDRWAIIGDAAYAPDPLFSNGLAFGTIQWDQMGEMLTQDLEGRLEPQFVDTLSDALMGPVIATQTAITNWYPSMHDPFLSAIRLNWIEIAYFYVFLPLVVNGCHYKPDRLKLFKLLQNTSQSHPFDITPDLIEARNALGQAKPEHFVYMGKEKVNLRAMDMLDDIRGIYEQGAEGGRIRNEYSRQILEKVKEMTEVVN
ncbi:MAG TPA: tryptophan 7-halogenase [Saprospiraceae bacterium]|nr:tryptophan 7-halogenase [Saprospiraceae bacterium]